MNDYLMISETKIPPLFKETGIHKRVFHTEAEGYFSLRPMTALQ